MTVAPPSTHAWSRPSIPVSGPHKFTSSDAPASGANFAEVLSLKDIGDEIGKASGLKCCFASTTKGFTALCIQAFTTAQSLGVLDELKLEMGDRIPGMFKTASGGLTSSMCIFSCSMSHPRSGFVVLCPWHRNLGCMQSRHKYSVYVVRWTPIPEVRQTATRIKLSKQNHTHQVTRSQWLRTSVHG